MLALERLLCTRSSFSILRFYNPRRLHSSLGQISPAEAERKAA